MTLRLRRLLIVAVVPAAIALTGCVDTSPPGPTPSPSVSPTQSPAASPTPSVTSTPSASPSAPPTDLPPQRVVGLTATVGGGSGEVLLTWTANPERDIDHYIVMRSDSPSGPRTRIGTMTPAQVALFPDLPFVDTSATVAYYRVRAVDAAGQQGPSSEVVCGASVGHSC